MNGDILPVVGAELMQPLLIDADVLGSLIEKFLSRDVNLSPRLIAELELVEDLLHVWRKTVEIGLEV